MNLRNKKTKNSKTLYEIVRKAYQGGQDADINETSQEKYKTKGDAFKRVYEQNNQNVLFAAKEINNVEYYIFGDNSTQPIDQINVKIVFFTKHSNLTEVIQSVYKDVKTKMKNENVVLSYQEKNVTIYRVMDGDIHTDGSFVTATFENKRTEFQYDIWESRITYGLSIVNIIVCIILAFVNKNAFGYSLSVGCTLLVASVNCIAKNKGFHEIVRIVDFKNLFGNSQLQSSSPTPTKPDAPPIPPAPQKKHKS